MLSLHLTRQQPVLCQSPYATTLRVQSGRAWVSVERARGFQAQPGMDAVLNPGDMLSLPAGAQAVASGLPSAVLAVLGPVESGAPFPVAPSPAPPFVTSPLSQA